MSRPVKRREVIELNTNQNDLFHLCLKRIAINAVKTDRSRIKGIKKMPSP